MKGNENTGETRRNSRRENALIHAHKIGYRATNDGRVISPRGREIKLQQLHGYKYFNVWHNGRAAHVTVHRLQALQKYGERLLNAKIETRHLDNTRGNNAAYNIAIGSHRVNCNDTPRERLQHPEQRRAVACSDGRRVNIYKSIYDAARFSGINAGSILKTARGERNTAGGYRWRFVDFPTPFNFSVEQQ